MPDNRDHGTAMTQERSLAELEELMRYRDGALHEEPLDDLARRGLINDLLDKSAGYQPTASNHADEPGAGRSILVPLTAVAAAAALVIGIGVAGRTTGSREPDSTTKTVAKEASPSNRGVLLSGQADLGELERLAPGAEVAEGKTLVSGRERAVFELGHGALLALDRNTRLEIKQMDGDEIALFLGSGSFLISLPPAPDRVPLAVTTRAGKVFVTGTLFEVRISRERTVLEVFRGSVRVADSEASRSVTAARSVILGAPGTKEIEPLRVEAVREAVEALERSRRDSVSAALSESDWDRVFPRVDDGSSPTEAVTQAVKDQRKGRDRKPEDVGPDTATGALAHSPGALFEQAQEARKMRSWELAAAIYQTLVRAYPASTEARIALVSLASLQLKQLDRPREALDNFERYLATPKGGSLDIEAAWGRATALGRLGLVSRERVALQEFLAKYPESFQAAEAKERLE